MLDTERGAHVCPGPLLLCSALPALASQPDQTASQQYHGETERSQLSQATFRSPTATVPLGTTTAGSTLPACFLSASLFFFRCGISKYGGRLLRTHHRQQFATTPASELRSGTFRRFHSPSGPLPNHLVHYNHAGPCQLLAESSVPDVRSLPSSSAFFSRCHWIIVPGSLRPVRLAVPFNLLEPSSGCTRFTFKSMKKNEAKAISAYVYLLLFQQVTDRLLRKSVG